MPESILEAMPQSIIDGAPDTALALAQTALASGLDLLEAINDGFVPGMHHVGEQFVQHAMFLPDMMASAEAMRAAMQVLEPELKKHGAERPVAGTVVLGTTQETSTRSAKRSSAHCLQHTDFKVHDLGVDVPSERFAAAALEVGADVEVSPC
jgi:trimethylamine corrinoid protein